MSGEAVRARVRRRQVKPLTKKLLESGVVEKNFAAMLERWGSLESGAVDEVKSQMVQQSVEDFVEEIDELLEAGAETKEMTINLTMGPTVSLYSPEIGVFSANYDEMGRLVVADAYKLKRGSRLWEKENMGVGTPFAEVLDIDSMYIGDIRVGYRLTIDRR
jgi:hypothetical protein